MRFTLVLGCLFALFAGQGASAEVPDPIADAVSGALLPQDCTLNADTPRIVMPMVEGTGGISCNRPRDEILLTVCIQHRQPVANESVTWQDLICDAVRTKQSRQLTVRSRCVPGEWAYRTVTTAAIFKNGNATENGSGIKVSPQVVLNCPIMQGA